MSEADRDAFQWTVKAHASLKAVKKMLVNSQSLALFDHTLHTIISTSASDYVLGAIKSQVGPDNGKRSVAFSSCTHSAVEHIYTTMADKALACIWAIEKWCTYLWSTSPLGQITRHCRCCCPQRVSAVLVCVSADGLFALCTSTMTSSTAQALKMLQLIACSACPCLLLCQLTVLLLLFRQMMTNQSILPSSLLLIRPCQLFDLLPSSIL